MNTLAYFPTVYPDELLYSVLARYHKHVGAPKIMYTLEALFGNQRVIAAYDLPGHIQALADRIPADRGLSADKIIDTLTLFQYFTAFESSSVRTKVREAMRIGAADNHIILGLSAFEIARNARLHFCPECMQQMLRIYGEMYWRRHHQLPGVLICLEHGCAILRSTVVFDLHSRHEFVAAAPENCGSNGWTVAMMPLDKDPVLDRRLAQRNIDLLERPPEARSFAGWTDFYRGKMLETGLAKSAHTMDQQKFKDEFHCFCGRTLELLPGVMSEGNFSNDWLAGMVRKHRKANHPLHHVLVQEFLAQRASRTSAFGSGPWSCINPLARHQSPAPIKTFTTHRNHGKTVGVFACNCGYVYTQCFDAKTNMIGMPRFLYYGPLLEPALRKLIANNAGLREAGRALRLDPKTVVRLTQELNITTVWRLKPSGKGRHTPRDLVIDNSPKSPRHDLSPTLPHRISGNNMRRNWSMIDSEWAAKITPLVRAIKNESPPIRITVAELERRGGQRGWLLKRRHRLPQTMDALDRVIEDTETFQLRRIHWSINELDRDGGPVKAWQIMRMAGLRSTSLDLINMVLEAVPLHWQNAA